MAKIVAIPLGKDFERKSHLSHYLSAPPSQKRPKQLLLKQLYDKVDWIKPLKTIRNEITHDGFWEAYNPIRYEAGLVSPPRVNTSLAPYLAAQMWSDLKELVQGFLKVLF